MGLASTSPWRKYYGSTPASLDYPHLTMYQMVAQAAKRKPNNTAYVFMGKKTSYQEFMQRIEAAAKGLYKMGIRKGDRVTICMANTPQALDCFYALNRIGAVPNMIHPLSAAQEIAFYLKVSHSKAILTLDQFYYKVAEILPQLEEPCQVLIAKVADELPAPLSLLYPMTKGARAIQKLPKVLGHIYVMLMVTLGFVLFNAESLPQAMGDIAGMFGLAGVPLVTKETLYYLSSYGLLFAAGFIGATPMIRDTAKKLSENPKCSKIVAVLEPVFLLALLLVCTAYLVDGSFSPFLYFRF